jgi:LytS/YehU family sensor histidine kinase
MFYSNFLNIQKLNNNNRIKIITGSLLTLAATLIVYQLIEASPVFPEQLALPLTLSTGTIVFYYAISTTYGIGKLWQYSENMRQRLDIEKKQAELSLLRSQLHPHFLFNTLNNLLAMVNQQQNPQLANALDRLSGLLRYVVYETAKGKVSVKKEIAFIRDFSELQRLRFEPDEVCFNLEIKGNYDDQLIEPGIFIPFIENAFKYGTEPEKESTIDMQFDLSEPSKIGFKLTNPVHPGMHKNSGNGSGIPSSKERLKLVYPRNYSLEIIKNDTFTVELEILTNESYNR